MFFKEIQFFLLFCAVMVFSIPGAQAEDSAPIVLSGIENSEYNILTGNIVKEAYRRIGRQAEIEYLPPNRAIMMSSKGMVDGEVSRIFVVGEKYPTLHRVPTPFEKLRVFVYTLNPDVIVEKKEDLAKYTVGYVKNLFYTTQLTKGLPHTIDVETVPRLFKLLVNKRVDLIIALEVTGRLEMDRAYPTIEYGMGSEPLVEIPIYHYLHEKNAALSPKLDKVFQDMQSNGELAAMRENFIVSKLKNSK